MLMHNKTHQKKKRSKTRTMHQRLMELSLKEIPLC